MSKFAKQVFSAIKHFSKQMILWKEQNDLPKYF